MRYLVPGTVVLFITATLLYTTHIGFDISNGTPEREESVLGNLVRKPLDSWTDTERRTFMGLKEAQYAERSERVRRFCVESQVTGPALLLLIIIFSRRISPTGPPAWRWSMTTLTRCPTAPSPRWRAPPGAGTSYTSVSYLNTHQP